MKPLKFKIDAKTDAAEIYIYDVVGGDLFGDGITAKAVADALKELKSVKNLTIRINSPGGDVFDGMAIRNQLLQSGKRLSVEIDGLAASIASVIAMAGSTIRMAEGGMMMIHDAWSGMVGNADELRKTADILDQISGEIAGIYAKRVKAEESAMRDLMKAETWMTPADALERGFITAVSEPMNMAACIDPQRFKYKNIPEQFLPGYQQEQPVDKLAAQKERILSLKGVSE